MSENELDDSLSIECAPDCQHSRAEHAAFDAGFKAGVSGIECDPHYSDALLCEAWRFGYSAGSCAGSNK